MMTTHGIALGAMALYGVICLAGGILGYVWKGSVASLVSGGIAGVLLLLCAAGVRYQPVLSMSVAIILSVALLGRFVPKLIQGWDQLGESNAIKVDLLITIGGVLVILACALALATKAAPPSAP